MKTTKHYTKSAFAAALLRLVPAKPTHVLDPAVGDGALLAASLDRWPGVPLSGYDISRAATRRASKRLPSANIRCVNALVVPWLLGTSHRRLVACNPPFGHIASHLLSGDRVDVRFLERALSSTGSSDVMLFVLPQSLAANSSYNDLRKHWLKRISLRTVVSLPDNAFDNTEAYATALVGIPGKPTIGPIDFVSLGRHAQVIHRTRARIDKTHHRLDAGYYIARSWTPALACPSRSVADTFLDLRRGTFIPKSRTRAHGARVLHSTDLSAGSLLSSANHVTPTDFPPTVTRGCVLIARVGAGLWNKFALYRSHVPAVATDCVFVGRTRTYEDAAYVGAALGTAFVRTSLRALSRGIAAPIIAKSDLLQLALPWPSRRIRLKFGSQWAVSRTSAERRRVVRLLDAAVTQ